MGNRENSHLEIVNVILRCSVRCTEEGFHRLQWFLQFDTLESVVAVLGIGRFLSFFLLSQHIKSLFSFSSQLRM